MSGAEAFGHDVRYAVEAIWKVLVWSVVLGAGLPMIFAFGVRSLAWGSGGQAVEGGTTTVGGRTAPRSGNPAGKVLAVVLFALVLYILAIGIYYIVVTGHGKELKFDSVWPSQVAKK